MVPVQPLPTEPQYWPPAGVHESGTHVSFMPPSFTITMGGGGGGSLLVPPEPAMTPEPAAGGLPAAAVVPPTDPSPPWVTWGGPLAQLHPTAAASVSATHGTRAFRFDMTLIPSTRPKGAKLE